MSDHAEVRVGDYTIPLIGIPREATLEECACCHDVFPILEVELDERGRPLCRRCRGVTKSLEQKNDH